MPIIEATRLYDVTVRLQIFVEAVKAYQARQFDRVLIGVRNEFDKLLGRLNFETLDGLTRTRLRALVMALKLSQSRLYSVYMEDVLKQLEAFTNAALVVNKTVYAALRSNLTFDITQGEEALNSYLRALGQQPEDESAAWLFGFAALTNPSRTWNNVINEPVAANGAYVKDFYRAFAASAQLSTANLLTKAYANATSTPKVREELKQTLTKIDNQSAAVSNTVMQHIAAIVSQTVASGLFGRYRWVSVIDSSTTDICYGRNNKIYFYGKGPLPPAHIGCRSITVPYQNGQDTTSETFYAFLQRQSSQIQVVAMGEAGAKLLRTGRIKANEVMKFANPAPLSPAQFQASIPLILNG